MSVAMRNAGLVALSVVIGLGGLTYYASLGGVFQPTNTTQVTTSGTTAVQAFAYSCAKPAVNSQNFCDQLPAGYSVSPTLAFGPGASCTAGMSDSACTVMKQTYANGVCDPNETVWTSPLDCGCTGAVVGDPYTGRCGSPATVCQLAATQEVISQQKQGG